MSPSRTPARDKASRVGAFEVEIEEAWFRLTVLKPMQRRTVCLSPNTGCLALRWPRPKPYTGEVGTYNSGIELHDFRDDCFEAFAQGRKA